VIRQAGCLRYLRDHRGVSIIALIIIMAVLGSLGYVFSSLIATKQYSMGMAAPSQQAFYIANSGIEFGIRYASEKGWTTGAALNGLNHLPLVNLGQGQFTLDYDQPADTLSSTGQVSASKREVALENFTSFVSDIKCLELVEEIDSPPISGIPACTYEHGHGHGHGHGSTNTYVKFYIRNTCSSQSTITLTQFSAEWKGGGKLKKISFDKNLKYEGEYKSGDGKTAFKKSQDVDTCHGDRHEGIQVLVEFEGKNLKEFKFKFYDKKDIEYTFPLEDPLPNC
jgi:hypothetical protein